MRPASGSATPDPDVAVIITTHGESALVAECIASVKDQTWAGWECVVMDDASSDDTVEVALAAIDGDRRFRVFSSDTRSGPELQRNAGVMATRAPLVTFLDGDDFYFPAALESRVAAMRRNPHPARAGVFCNWVEVAHDAVRHGEVPRKRRRPRVTWLKPGEVQGVPFIATAPVIDRRALLATGGFRILPVSEDVDLWQRMLRNGFYFDSVKEVGLAYRQRPASKLRESSVAAADTLAGIVARNSEPMEDPAAIGPWPLREPFYAYGPRLMRVRRLVRAAAFELAADRTPDRILDALDASFEPWMEWMLPLPRVVASTARLAALAVDDDERTAARLAGTLTELVEPLSIRGRRAAVRWQEVTPAGLDTGEAGRTCVWPTT
jgi:glycosyltransferase involved in cell wall biosynthesis